MNYWLRSPNTTAVGLSSVSCPLHSEETHYLIDGHKLHAAFETGKPIQFLSFVALSTGVSTPDAVKTVLERLAY
jgi:hypothetical protein